MSYCVNCGVELHDSAAECPLCNTIVYNPKAVPFDQVIKPFPVEHGEVEEVKRKDVGILVTVVLASIALTSGLLNRFAYNSVLWSFPIIGACLVIWVMCLPFFVKSSRNVYVWILFNAGATILYLYLLTQLIGSSKWFWGLGVPICVWVWLCMECVALAFGKLPVSFLTGSVYVVSFVGVLCIGLECLIERYIYRTVNLGWSAIVLCICAIIDISLITILSHRRLRNAIRKRLHF